MPSKFQYIIIFLLVVIAGWFYWYEWRPAQIKRACSEEAATKAHEILENLYRVTGEDRYKKALEFSDTGYNKEDYTWQYDKCLNERGIR